jgi:probable F420-dependent oxidoreductase
MEFGIIFANAGLFAEPEGAVAIGRAAEDNGFESVWTVEHVVVPHGYESEYPYSRDGRMPGPEQVAVPDPLAWLTWVGAHTTTLKLGTGILILPQRNPLVLAKETATIDRLTKGRLLLGIGVGWLREEYEALGVGWDDRAARADDNIRALRALWAEGAVSYSGTHSSFHDVYSEPKPIGGSVPVVVGGHSKAAARRAGRLGDGFFPADGRSLPELLPVMRAAAVEAGRDPDAIEITTGGRADLESLKALADQGVDRFVIGPPTLDPEALPDALARFADEVIAHL